MRVELSSEIGSKVMSSLVDRDPDKVEEINNKDMARKTLSFNVTFVYDEIYTDYHDHKYYIEVEDI